jgi:predicted ATPase
MRAIFMAGSSGLVSGEATAIAGGGKFGFASCDDGRRCRCYTATVAEQREWQVALIEGFRVQNYRSLRDVRLGRLSDDRATQSLTPLTAVIGQNGTGKSALVDAFGFIADCLATDVESACDQNQRGGFDRLRSMGSGEPIRFEITYRETPGELPVTYRLGIDLDASGRPSVAFETLFLSKKSTIYPYDYYHFIHGKGRALADVDPSGNGGERTDIQIELTDPRQLGIATLGTLRDHPRVVRFRDFLKGWYLSYFQPDAARRLPIAGPQKHLNAHGDNIGNVVQFMQREYKSRFATILQRIAERIPGITGIDTLVTEDKRVLLRFNDRGFQDPFYASQMSDGTLKVFAYLLLLEDPDPPPFICIEEPENGLYHKLLEVLAREFRSHATGKKNAPQIFVTTHQPYFVDALTPEEVWILEKGADGFSKIRRASDLQIVRNMVAEGLPLGGLWHSDYLNTH